MPNQDETGLEVAGCRHGIAQMAANMFRGEMYVCPHRCLHVLIGERQARELHMVKGRRG